MGKYFISYMFVHDYGNCNLGILSSKTGRHPKYRNSVRESVSSGCVRQQAQASVAGCKEQPESVVLCINIITGIAP
ncbi:MAG: hypothetical protein BGO09_13395 [Bacteroidetes bacterium 47-18]|nr:MAG: hypothetical protein BGO09_13395 [Bacteroidetes bacterium 47-18]